MLEKGWGLFSLSLSLSVLGWTLRTATFDHFLHFLDERGAVRALERVLPGFGAEGGATRIPAPTASCTF